MRKIVNINGYPTPIEFTEPLVQMNKINGITELRVGNIVELMGQVEIQTATIGNFSEGHKAIDISGFSLVEVLTVQATALDNNTGTLLEHAHIGQVTNNGFNVYGSTGTTEPKKIKVNWYIKGIING